MNNQNDKSKSNRSGSCGNCSDPQQAKVTPGIDIDEQLRIGTGRTRQGGQAQNSNGRSSTRSKDETTHLGKTQSTTNSQ